MGIDVDAVARRSTLDDRVGGAPLDEAGAELAVLGQPLAQSVEALGDRLARRQGQRLGAGVDLDAGNDPLTFEHFDQRGTVV